MWVAASHSTKPVDVFCHCHLTWNRLGYLLGDLIQCVICRVYGFMLTKRNLNVQTAHGTAVNVSLSKYMCDIAYLLLIMLNSTSFLTS